MPRISSGTAVKTTKAGKKKIIRKANARKAVQIPTRTKKLKSLTKETSKTTKKLQTAVKPPKKNTGTKKVIVPKKKLGSSRTKESVTGDKTLQNYFDSIRSLEFNARDWQVELISNEGQLIIFCTIFCNLETLHEGQLIIFWTIFWNFLTLHQFDLMLIIQWKIK